MMLSPRLLLPYATVCPCCRNYEALFNAILPDTHKQKEMREKITQNLIVRKSSRKNSNSNHGRILNPINTLPNLQRKNTACSEESTDSPALGDWKPSGQLFERAEIASGKPKFASRQSSTQSRSEESVISSEMLNLANEALNSFTPRIDLESLRMRQIELQERKVPKDDDGKKMPWRPPGLNRKVSALERRPRKHWTPFAAPQESPGSSDSIESKVWINNSSLASQRIYDFYAPLLLVK
jgi:hypothetical protein